MFKTVTFVFHMLIISTNACTGEVKFRAVELKIFSQFIVWDTTPAANTVREVGHKQSIINFFILSLTITIAGSEIRIRKFNFSFYSPEISCGVYLDTHTSRPVYYP